VAAGPFEDLAAVQTGTLRNAEIVTARRAGTCLDEIAAEYRLSRSRVKQIVAGAAEEEAEKNRAGGRTDAFGYLSLSVRRCLYENGLSTVDAVQSACLEFAGGAGLLRCPKLGKLKLRQVRRWLLLQTGDPRFDGADANRAQRFERWQAGQQDLDTSIRSILFDCVESVDVAVERPLPGSADISPCAGCGSEADHQSPS